MKLDLTNLNGRRTGALDRLQLAFPGALFTVEVPDTTGDVFDGWTAGVVQFSIEMAAGTRRDITFDELLQVALFMGTPLFTISYWEYDFIPTYGEEAGWIFTTAPEDWNEPEN